MDLLNFKLFRQRNVKVSVVGFEPYAGDQPGGQAFALHPIFLIAGVEGVESEDNTANFSFIEFIKLLSCFFSLTV